MLYEENINFYWKLIDKLWEIESDNVLEVVNLLI